MKGMVGLAIILLAVGIVYVLVKRPVVTTPITSQNNSNAVFSTFGNIAGNLINAFANSGTKIGAASAVTGDSTSGLNSLSSAQYDALRSVDQAQGVEGPF